MFDSRQYSFDRQVAQHIRIVANVIWLLGGRDRIYL